ncbi:MAG: hypothetical protein CSA75_00890 [Sorangium cellulosum]|nr:MAG: hypothetical protein CSA75_00890 [Sorangium cellulosum]
MSFGFPLWSTCSTYKTIRRFTLLPIVLLSSLPWGCANENETTPSFNDASTDTTASASSLSFSPDGTITVVPGALTQLSVAVSPPDVHVVRFDLLGDSLDASLDADEKVTNADGVTSLTLTSPASATTFRLRASAGEGATAEVAVSVSGEGFVRVNILPSYAGIRSTPTWTASAVARTLCADIPGQPPQEGPIQAQATEGHPVVLESIPVGTNIAITLRSNQAVGGCTDLSDLVPGVDQDVTVKVNDIPADLSATNLAMEMSTSSDADEVWPMYEKLIETFISSLFHHDKSEATTILDAMQSQVTSESDFAEARLMGGWDALTASLFDEGGQLLSDTIRAMIYEGFEGLRGGDTARGQLIALDADSKHGMLALGSFLGLPVDRIGMPKKNIVSLALEPGDTMILGGSFSCLPSQLIAAAADTGATTSFDTNALTTIIDTVNCEAIASMLESSSPLPSSCDRDCLVSACMKGIESIWMTARNRSALSFDTASLSFTVSGIAKVNGDRVVVALDAMWAGTQSHGNTKMSIKGTVSANQDSPLVY